MNPLTFGQYVGQQLKTAGNVYYGGGKTQAELADEDDIKEMRQMLPPVPAPGAVTRTRVQTAAGTAVAPPVTTNKILPPVAMPKNTSTPARPAPRTLPALPKGPQSSRDFGGVE
jgi:hypothetical protein